MERTCAQCHAQVGEEIQADWCPACGGAIVERAALTQPSPTPVEIDHRGIVLPRRHALGGIITPQ